MSDIKFTGYQCDICNDGKKYLAPTFRCPSCGADKLQIVEIDKEGTIYSWTRVEVSGSKYANKVPYIAAIVELKEGIKTSAHIEECDPYKVEIGMPVLFHRYNNCGRPYFKPKKK